LRAITENVPLTGLQNSGHCRPSSRTARSIAPASRVRRSDSGHGSAVAGTVACGTAVASVCRSSSLCWARVTARGSAPGSESRSATTAASRQPNCSSLDHTASTRPR
jgi:hypothetical protein